MQQLVISAHFQGQADAPSGEPPTTDPSATSVSILVDGPLEVTDASYENHVVFTGPSIRQGERAVSIFAGSTSRTWVSPGLPRQKRYGN